MSNSESRFGVWLHQRRVGTLNHRDHFTWLSLDDEYVADPGRDVLGLVFEDDLAARHAASMRLPNWFGNLLPEGRLREMIAVDQGVPVRHEMQLLARVGHDLPGAVRVLEEDDEPDPLIALDSVLPASESSAVPLWKFSLAGVAIKFSMIRRSDRLRLPASGTGGDWIVKLPDPTYGDVPRNEYAMMHLAYLSGIDTPEHLLVRRDDLVNIPDAVWQSKEDIAYAVRRFDRPPDGSRIHMEDLAQVRNFMARDKYLGTYESVASYAFRRVDIASLHEFVRRMVFNILISNGDAHLKNWSLLYEDARRPRLSPVYDLVSTALYRPSGGPEAMALKLNGTRKFELQRIGYFATLGRRLGADGAELADVARETVERVNAAWPDVADILEEVPGIQRQVAASIAARTSTLLRDSR